ncbi:MAG TPA: hypothetical protein DD856_01045 [Sulfobacillus sp.]|nr:hypothetical protein [Sulfobacillus sp.]
MNAMSPMVDKEQPENPQQALMLISNNETKPVRRRTGFCILLGFTGPMLLLVMSRSLGTA